MGRFIRSISECHLWRCFVLILVLCGTQKQDFSRMIKAVETLAQHEKIVVQAGHTEYESDKIEIFDFISAEELKKLYDQADYIVTHGGAGSVFQAIKASKRTLIFPRLQKYGEHVDDHQLQLANKLHKMGYLLTFNDDDDIITMFDKLKQFKPKAYELKGDIIALIDQRIMWDIHF